MSTWSLSALGTSCRVESQVEHECVVTEVAGNNGVKFEVKV